MIFMGFHRRTFSAAILASMALYALPAQADDHAGDPSADVVVENEMEFPADAEWKHSFDAYEAEPGKVNASLRRALAFSKAMEAQGVDPARVKVAIVVHGPSVFDVAIDTRYAAKHDTGDAAFEANPSADTVAQLIARGAEIWVCGFAAKYHKVGNADLLPGVKMAPTGTVAHAELQRRGFGINAY
ncbi:MAG: DsrE family protein [Pseudomonadota bacterium]